MRCPCIATGKYIFRSLLFEIHNVDIKWKHFPRYWPFVRGIHRSPVNSPHRGQWRGALMFSLMCVWINGWVNNREAGDVRRYRAHYDVSVKECILCIMFVVRTLPPLVVRYRWFLSVFSGLVYWHDLRIICVTLTGILLRHNTIKCGHKIKTQR